MSTSTDDEPPEDRMIDIYPAPSAGGVRASRVSQRKVSSPGTKTTNTKMMDLEIASVSDGPGVEERDFHSKQVTQGCQHLDQAELTDWWKIGLQRMDSGMVSELNI